MNGFDFGAISQKKNANEATSKRQDAFSCFWSHHELCNGSPVCMMSQLGLLRLMPQKHQQHHQSPPNFEPGFGVGADFCEDWDQD